MVEITGRILVNAAIKVQMMYGGTKSVELKGVRPELLARAALNPATMMEVAKTVEQSNTWYFAKCRLLNEILSPHLQIQQTLFGKPIGSALGIDRLKLSVGRDCGTDCQIFPVNCRNLSDILPMIEHQFPEIRLEMKDIPAGKFMLGSSEDGVFETDRPLREATLPGYRIGQYGVTNEQYGIFCLMTGHSLPEYWDDASFGKNQPNNPVVGVSWNDAKSFAEWLGMGLPTEAQWEKAARGTEGSIYPWGDEFGWDKANFHRHIPHPYVHVPCPVDMHPEGASPYGVEDMAGNVNEWVEQDPLYEFPWPTESEGWGIRGGSHNANSCNYLQGSSRQFQPDLMASSSEVGFRVVWNDPEAE